MASSVDDNKHGEGFRHNNMVRKEERHHEETGHTCRYSTNANHQRVGRPPLHHHPDMHSSPPVHNTGQRAVYHYHFSQSSDLRASGDCPHKCQNAPKAAILQKPRPPSKDRIRPISTRAATALPPNSCCCLLPAFLQLTREARRDVNGGEGNGAAG